MKLSPVFFILLVALASAGVFAATYEFGTKQGGSGFSVQPGESADAEIYFFVDSAYGDRTTHVSVAVSTLPDDWSVEYYPPLKEQEYNVSGVLTNVSENIYVEPRPLLLNPPDINEEGYTYFKSPSGKGYLQARKVSIKINVPEDAQLGKTYKVSVLAEAFWLGNIGQVALRQSRIFHYTVSTARTEYTEQIVVAQQAEQKEQPTEAGPDNTLLYAVAAIAIIAILLVIYLYTKKNKSAPETYSPVVRRGIPSKRKRRK